MGVAWKELDHNSAVTPPPLVGAVPPPPRPANAIGNDQFHWKELNLFRDCLIYSDQFDPTPAEGSTQMSKKYRTYELRVATERLLQNRDFLGRTCIRIRADNPAPLKSYLNGCLRL